MPRLTQEHAAILAALDSDPDYIAYIALGPRGTEGSRGAVAGFLDALQLWTTWDRAEAVGLLNPWPPKPTRTRDALTAGLGHRVGRTLGPGEALTYGFLIRVHRKAGGAPRIETTDGSELIRVCERCQLVTRGKRNASRCTTCGHRHSPSISEGTPHFRPCPECHVRPVSDTQVRCDACDAERTKAMKAAQARRRRARERAQRAAP